MKLNQLLILLLLILLVLPLTYAQEEDEEEQCGILNLASCLPKKMFEYTSNVFNQPLQPLLSLTKKLLSEPVDTDFFIGLWALIIYIISLFYGLLFMYSGFNFMISGHDVIKRENAKNWLRNIVIMIVLVQSSLFIYNIVLEVNSILTSSILNLVDKDFFLLTADNLVNFGLQFFFGFIYLITLFLTVLLLVLRYIIIAVGVVFTPIGIFFYFINPLKDFGKLILSFLGTCIFVSFLDSVVILVCSGLLQISIFENIKILVMISAFSVVNFLMFYFMLFSAIKSAVSTGLNTVFKVGVIKRFMD